MVKQATLLSELQSIVGKEHAQEPGGDRRYEVDGLTPQAVAEPGAYEQVAEVIRFANSERLAVVPHGSGRLMHIGNTPSRYDIALSLARLDKIIQHEPADLTITCQAGIAVGALNAHLAASGQTVPFSRNPDDRRSVGGLLAANESGLGQAYGRPRDFTIGLRFVTGDGLIAKTGGRVVKNVAGYDLAKLFIGSRGTLAIITEATFKVAPLPEETRALNFLFPSAEDFALFLREARRRTLALLSAIAITPAGAGSEEAPPSAGFLCRILSGGPTAAVERTTSELRSLASAHNGAPAEQSPLPQSNPPDTVVPTGAAQLQCRASVPPSRLAEAVRAIEDECLGASLQADPFAGRILITYPGAADQADVAARLLALMSRLDGDLVIETCSPELKRRTDVFGEPPPSFPLMRAIKRQFDPNNVLSPGRFVGRL